MYYHKIEPEYFDEMLPWERDMYITMMAQKIEEEKDKAKQDANERASRARRQALKK